MSEKTPLEILAAHAALESAVAPGPNPLDLIMHPTEGALEEPALALGEVSTAIKPLDESTSPLHEDSAVLSHKLDAPNPLIEPELPVQHEKWQTLQSAAILPLDISHSNLLSENLISKAPSTQREDTPMTPIASSSKLVHKPMKRAQNDDLVSSLSAETQFLKLLRSEA
jgi:hypothetical protein